MKILLATLALLLVFVPVSQGKLISGYGFKTGIVRANQEFRDPDISLMYWGVESLTWRTGFGIVGYLEWFDLSPLGVVTEIGYIQKGAIEKPIPRTDESGNRLNPFQEDHCLDYLVVSFLTKLTLHKQCISPYLIVGPRLDIYLPTQDPSTDDKYKSIDFGGDIGLGMEFSFSKLPTIFLEGRYSHNFIGSFKVIELGIDPGLNRKNKSYQIFVGLRL